MSAAFLQSCKTPPFKCPQCNTKPANGKALVMVFGGMWSTPSLPLLHGPLWCVMAASVCVKQNYLIIYST